MIKKFKDIVTQGFYQFFIKNVASRLEVTLILTITT